MENNGIHENLIEITRYECMGELPDPFVFNDGTRMTDPAEWPRRRAEIYRDAIDLQYGTMPPEPEFLEVEPIYLGGRGSLNSYRIITGTRAKPIAFTMYIFKARCKEKAPAVISGDMCFISAFRENYVAALVDNDINFVTFNRTELAHDVARYNLNGLDKDSGEYAAGEKIYEGLDTGNCGGQVKATYPEYTFGAVGAWAWGYSRCVDALEILGNVDMSLIAFTGHSRGGKTAALAGALDERAAIVNPNATCSGGYSSYRIHIEAKTEDGSIKKSEPLSNIFHHFPAWMGQGMKEYIGREDELPFDAHHLKAMVAPRVLLVTEAASDIMANPVGSYQTTEAAAEVFKFLGCEQNLIWHFRRGGHSQTVEDLGQLVNVIDHIRRGEPLNEKFFKLPFKPIKPAYSWKCPEKKG
jgi:hypothetical protein